VVQLSCINWDIDEGGRLYVDAACSEVSTADVLESRFGFRVNQ
jgi:hypothetical protein